MKIFDPIKIKNVVFQNRVVMAPMVPFGLPANEDGSMSNELMHHYLQRIPNGVGLMICQALSVTSDSRTSQKAIAGGAGAYSDAHIAYINQLAEACHSYGTKFFAQLAYPSAGHRKGDSINQLTEADMEKIKNEFVRGAEICKKAGCDGIEFHGAHGYFLNMVLSPLSNKREDKYGGDISGRLLLIEKIIKGIKGFAGDDFIISYRMGWNDDLKLDVQTAQALERIGIELLHVSFGIPSDRKVEVPDDFSYDDIVYTGAHIKKHVNIPVTVVNDIRTLSRGNALLEKGFCDFAAYGTPFLADEAFLIKSLNNYDYKPCFRCRNCQWFISGEKCPAQIKNK
ncbi:MAG: NADH:flavin oxidoreductase [Clostridiaceae bacterium]|jgi:2,4-dienoyl-CoA reductase-like NADH-dependent reductase (Old Yellow Enzyme family)|nr:NADH:flavin oxidoreductase [Clostridiaceae bacterium]